MKQILAGGVSLCALFATAHADPVEPLSEAGDVIFVKGQKIEQSLIEVTSSVDVMTGEEILREPIVNLYDIVNRVPNVTSSLGGLGFAIRGVDQRSVGGSGAALTVYVDDSPLSNQTTFFGPLDSWDLDQVEIYRGPQSTNFGRNALAGAIYVRTQDPSYEWDIRARAEAGNNGVLQGAVALGGPIIEDKLAFRFAANYRESDGFIFNTFLNEEEDATELETYRFKLLLEPTDRIRIVSTSSYTENFAGEDILDPTNGNPGNPLEADDVIREVARNLNPSEGTESFIQSINAEIELTDRFSIQSITTYQDTDYTRIEDFDSTPAALAELDRSGIGDALSEELRLKYIGDRLSGALGFYYVETEDGFDDVVTVPASVIVPPSVVPVEISSQLLIDRLSTTRTELTNYALFLDGEYGLSNRFDVLFGLRYDVEEQKNRSSTNNQVQGGLPPAFSFLAPLLGETIQTTEAEYDAFLPKGGVRWNIDPETNVSFVVQRAYRAGGAEINFVTGGIDEFDPEFLVNYELAFRNVALDGRLRTNVNIYYSDWSDQQVFVPIPGVIEALQTVNAGESTLYGFEGDVSYQVTDGLELYGGIGYAFTEFDDFPNADFDPNLPESEANQANFDGNRFPFAPRWSLNGGATYRHTSGLFGGVDVNYQSNTFQTNQNFSVNEFGERTLVNARLGYALTDNINLSAYVRNLLDEQFFTSLDVSELGNEFARLGQERTWAFRLDLDF